MKKSHIKTNKVHPVNLDDTLELSVSEVNNIVPALQLYIASLESSEELKSLAMVWKKDVEIILEKCVNFCVLH